MAAAGAMAALSALLALLVLVSPATAQLPNARVGLAPDGPPLKSQAGYPIVNHDIAFGERYLMHIKYYNLPEQPLYYKDKSPLKVACGYPFNAYWTSNTAIHPYWFKQFGLDRWCRQDVCLSVWLPDRSHDLMFKITDVCDPKDCPTPLDFKVEPYKGRYLWHIGPNDKPGYRPSGPVQAYFVKCWADAMPQPDLLNTLSGPPLKNSRSWMIEATAQQWANNQKWNENARVPSKPLGSLWRPQATMTSVPFFKASDYPPGSSAKVTRKGLYG